jgi:serine/threonine protein kinase
MTEQQKPPERNSGSDSDSEFQILGLPEIDDPQGLRSRAPFEILASQFVEELRQGHHPSIELYARRFPPHAAGIREFFPVLAMLENARIDKETASLRQNMPERFPFTQLGRYEILCEIARGGMGVVFQARDVQSQQVVAVKLLPWRMSVVPEWLRRFEQEAKTASQLHHRNIVPVSASGHEHGYCYYVMRFVNGVSLDRVIERLSQTNGVIYHDEIRRLEAARPTGFVASSLLTPGTERQVYSESAPPQRRRRLTSSSWRAFARIGIQAAQALEFAHRAGILHNDIKPGNVLLDVDGRVWVTDFGLSQPFSTSASISHCGLRTGIHSGAGTLRYMAPERLLGTSDHRSDIYSIGMTLYELVLQRPAHCEKDPEQLISAVLDHVPQTPCSVRSEIPTDLETIILNCIAKDPADRYRTAADLGADLLRFCGGDRVFPIRPRGILGLVRKLRNHLRADS